MIEWFELTETCMPPAPRTPYECYLVWWTHKTHRSNPNIPLGFSGVCRVAQWSRDQKKFLFYEEEHEITHWAKINAPDEVQKTRDEMDAKLG